MIDITCPQATPTRAPGISQETKEAVDLVSRVNKRRVVPSYVHRRTPFPDLCNAFHGPLNDKGYKDK